MRKFYHATLYYNALEILKQSEMITQVDLVDLYKYLSKENKSKEPPLLAIYCKNHELHLSLKDKETSTYSMLLY